MKKIAVVAFMIMLMIGLAGCSAYGPGGMDLGNGYIDENMTDDEFNEIVENEFVLTSEQKTSNVSLSANTAAYTTIRNFIKNKQKISKNQVRIEEMINYFKYQYGEPEGNDVLNTVASVIKTPWTEDTYLLTVGMQAKNIETTDIRNNLVFLLDVSGSMYAANKLPLMQQAFIMLLQNLDENDRVSIVTYAGSDAVLLDGEMGSEKLKIEAIISDLQASGSTAGAKGIQTAYSIARKNFIEGGNNRVILATDGDFNVGISSQKGLEELIVKEREDGIYLSVFGFGMGNYKDNKLETLASKGNGNYGYIDNLLEARKALIEDINGTLYTVARDAKAQISFNEDVVEAYRLIGYENRQLTDEEFDDDKTDAGEIGAGHQVTVVYEIKLKDDFVEDAKYADFIIRYKDPEVGKDTVLEQVTELRQTTLLPQNDDINFITSVVEFGLILRDSKFKGTANLYAVLERLEDIVNLEDDPYKHEFKTLIEIYKSYHE
jgi:Ca-activated chloride channel family protein